MPVSIGKDSKGSFARWGSSGKKYYFNPRSETSKEEAIRNAARQGAAARASGYRE